MKALSLKQPWAELILRRKKTIEIRKWNTKFKGYFLIHASKNVDKNALEFFDLESNNLLKGYVIGYAKLVKVIKYQSEKEFLNDKDKHLNFGKKEFPIYGFVLNDIHRIKPFKYNGKLGFFDITSPAETFLSKFHLSKL